MKDLISRGERRAFLIELTMAGPNDLNRTIDLKQMELVLLISLGFCCCSTGFNNVSSSAKKAHESTICTKLPSA